ncbi:MAG: DNA-binding protein, partial [Campylobacterota bacterium]|nr:DNA-binding protein [Campylobacterota bacterium]
ISSQFALTPPEVLSEEPEALEVEIEEESKEIKKPISLKKYLKSKDFSEKKVQKIKERFKKRAKKDSRITIIENKIYVDPSKYSYSDLM